jgi:hypothetical protein
MATKRHAWAATDKAREATYCKHPEVLLIGSDETGLRAIKCAGCGIPMNRTVHRDGYHYEPARIEF